MPADTLPRLLRRNAASMGARPAMREKRHGIWQTLSWSGYETLVLQLARGLAAHGFRAGDRLAVLGDNRPRLYAALVAAQALGGVGVPLWPDADPAGIARVLRDAGARVVVAQDHEQVDKVIVAKAGLPGLDLVVSLDPRAARDADADWLIDFAALQAQGAALDTAVGGIADGRPDDLALLLYRADQPGIMLTHANLLAAAHAITAVEDVRPTDNIVCFMPMAWIGDMLGSLTLGLTVGFTCNCPESPETARRDWREIGPSIVLAPPAVWESWLTDIENRMAHASGLKRIAFAWARRVAEAAEHRREAGIPRGWAERCGLAVAGGVAFAALRDQLGLSRLRWAHTGGTPVAPDVWRLYRAFGVNLKQSYGPAELSGLAAVQPANPVAADTVGLAVPGMEITIAANGEVLARGDNVCGGYFGDPAAGHLRTTEDGWWRTGDAGALDANGRLTIDDRLTDTGRLADATRFAPAAIEARLRRSPFIAEALAFGDGKPFVAALLALDRTALGEWAVRHRLPGTSLAELVALPEARVLLREELRACNADLPVPLQVRRFMLLDHPLDADDLEARLYRERFRQQAVAQHAAEIDALFRDPARTTEVPDDNVRDPRSAVEDVEAQPGLEPANA